mmetsp:Transcript_88112/g.197010  ORF Transcript_88112/g.197010 Transcript_88112/m.197010 type:complete len:199 (-) Transcript_88112:331-927(-)
MASRALACVFLALAVASGASSTPSAAELRRYKGTTCTGEYDALNKDVMGECHPYLIPKPASVKVEYLNDTYYTAYHYSGVQDCSGSERTQLAVMAVGQCQDLGDNTSQQRVWITTPAPPPTTCAAPGDCGRAYQACCVGFGVRGHRCGCHLHGNGSGTALSQDCGVCGKAFVACCSAFVLQGHPCTCDLSDAAGALVI